MASELKSQILLYKRRSGLQLRPLAYNIKKAPISLLYNPNEARRVNIELLQSIALEKFESLQESNPDVKEFEELFVSVKTRDFLKAKKLRKLEPLINNFLDFVAGFWLDERVLHCLEFLIRRFNIERHNVEYLMSMSLPFYESKMFVRLVQILELPPTSLFLFLENVAKSGISPPESLFVNKCVRDVNLLIFLSSSTKRIFQTVKNPSIPLLKFYTRCCINVFADSKFIFDESILRQLMSEISFALQKSDQTILFDSGLCILLQVSQKLSLSKEMLNAITVEVFYSLVNDNTSEDSFRKCFKFLNLFLFNQIPDYPLAVINDMVNPKYSKKILSSIREETRCSDTTSLISQIVKNIMDYSKDNKLQITDVNNFMTSLITDGDEECAWKPILQMGVCLILYEHIINCTNDQFYKELLQPLLNLLEKYYPTATTNALEFLKESKIHVDSIKKIVHTLNQQEIQKDQQAETYAVLLADLLNEDDHTRYQSIKACLINIKPSRSSYFFNAILQHVNDRFPEISNLVFQHDYIWEIAPPQTSLFHLFNFVYSVIYKYFHNPPWLLSITRKKKPDGIIYELINFLDNESQSKLTRCFHIMLQILERNNEIIDTFWNMISHILIPFKLSADLHEDSDLKSAIINMYNKLTNFEITEYLKKHDEEEFLKLSYFGCSDVAVVIVNDQLKVPSVFPSKGKLGGIWKFLSLLESQIYDKSYINSIWHLWVNTLTEPKKSEGYVACQNTIHKYLKNMPLNMILNNLHQYLVLCLCDLMSLDDIPLSPSDIYPALCYIILSDLSLANSYVSPQISDLIKIKASDLLNNLIKMHPCKEKQIIGIIIIQLLFFKPEFQDFAIKISKSLKSSLKVDESVECDFSNIFQIRHVNESLLSRLEAKFYKQDVKKLLNAVLNRSIDGNWKSVIRSLGRSIGKYLVFADLGLNFKLINEYMIDYIMSSQSDNPPIDLLSLYDVNMHEQLRGEKNIYQYINHIGIKYGDRIQLSKFYDSVLVHIVSSSSICCNLDFIHQILNLILAFDKFKILRFSTNECVNFIHYLLSIFNKLRESSTLNNDIQQKFEEILLNENYTSYQWLAAIKQITNKYEYLLLLKHVYRNVERWDNDSQSEFQKQVYNLLVKHNKSLDVCKYSLLCTTYSTHIQSEALIYQLLEAIYPNITLMLDFLPYIYIEIISNFWTHLSHQNLILKLYFTNVLGYILKFYPEAILNNINILKSYIPLLYTKSSSFVYMIPRCLLYILSHYYPQKIQYRRLSCKFISLSSFNKNAIESQFSIDVKGFNEKKLKILIDPEEIDFFKELSIESTVIASAQKKRNDSKSDEELQHAESDSDVSMKSSDKICKKQIVRSCFHEDLKTISELHILEKGSLSDIYESYSSFIVGFILIWEYYTLDSEAWVIDSILKLLHKVRRHMFDKKKEGSEVKFFFKLLHNSINNQQEIYENLMELNPQQTPFKTSYCSIYIVMNVIQSYFEANGINTADVTDIVNLLQLLLTFSSADAATNVLIKPVSKLGKKIAKQILLNYTVPWNILTLLKIIYTSKDNCNLLSHISTNLFRPYITTFIFSKHVHIKNDDEQLYEKDILLNLIENETFEESIVEDILKTCLESVSSNIDSAVQDLDIPRIALHITVLNDLILIYGNKFSEIFSTQCNKLLPKHYKNIFKCLISNCDKTLMAESTNLFIILKSTMKSYVTSNSVVVSMLLDIWDCQIQLISKRPVSPNLELLLNLFTSTIVQFSRGILLCDDWQELLRSYFTNVILNTTYLNTFLDDSVAEHTCINYFKFPDENYQSIPYFALSKIYITKKNDSSTLKHRQQTAWFYAINTLIRTIPFDKLLTSIIPYARDLMSITENTTKESFKLCCLLVILGQSIKYTTPKIILTCTTTCQNLLMALLHLMKSYIDSNSQNNTEENSMHLYYSKECQSGLTELVLKDYLPESPSYKASFDHNYRWMETGLYYFVKHWIYKLTNATLQPFIHSIIQFAKFDDEADWYDKKEEIVSPFDRAQESMLRRSVILIISVISDELEELGLMSSLWEILPQVTESLKACQKNAHAWHKNTTSVTKSHKKLKRTDVISNNTTFWWLDLGLPSLILLTRLSKLYPSHSLAEHITPVYFLSYEVFGILPTFSASKNESTSHAYSWYSCITQLGKNIIDCVSQTNEQVVHFMNQYQQNLQNAKHSKIRYALLATLRALWTTHSIHIAGTVNGFTTILAELLENYNENVVQMTKLVIATIDKATGSDISFKY